MVAKLVVLSKIEDGLNRQSTAFMNRKVVGIHFNYRMI